MEKTGITAIDICITATMNNIVHFTKMVTNDTVTDNMQ